MRRPRWSSRWLCLQCLLLPCCWRFSLNKAFIAHTGPPRVHPCTTFASVNLFAVPTGRDCHNHSLYFYNSFLMTNASAVFKRGAVNECHSSTRRTGNHIFDCDCTHSQCKARTDVKLAIWDLIQVCKATNGWCWAEANRLSTGEPVRTSLGCWDSEAGHWLMPSSVLLDSIVVLGPSRSHLKTGWWLVRW